MPQFGYTQALSEAITSVTATNSVELGQRVVDNGRDYVYVFNAGTTQINPGQGGLLATGSTGYSVTVTTTSGAPGVLGVNQDTTMTTATYGWLQTKGFGQFEASTNISFVSGRVFVIGADGNWTDNVSALSGTNMQGISVEAVASAASGTGYFNITI